MSVVSILKSLAIILAVVFTAVLIDSGFLYHQAATGKKLPFKLGLFPRIGGELA